MNIPVFFGFKLKLFVYYYPPSDSYRDDFQLPTSDFRLRSSDFQLSTSVFQLLGIVD